MCNVSLSNSPSTTTQSVPPSPGVKRPAPLTRRAGVLAYPLFVFALLRQIDIRLELDPVVLFVLVLVLVVQRNASKD